MPDRSLINRNFLLLWQGQLVSLVGVQVSKITMLLWLKHATESAPLVGAMTMLSGLAAVLLAPIGGAVADRYSRRSIIIICDLISGLSVISLSLLMFFAPVAKEWALAWVFVVSIVLSVANIFFSPAISASTADLAPKGKVASANSLLQASIQISNLLGQGIGGMLFRALGAPLVLLIDGVTCLFSACSKCFLAIPQSLTEKHGNWRARTRELKREIWEGYCYVGANTGLTHLILIAASLNFFVAPILGLFPFYVEDYLKFHPDWFGYLLAVYGAGNLLGYLLAGTIIVPGRARADVMIAVMMLASVLFGLLGVVKTQATVAAVVASSGVASGFINVNVSTILQITTPSEVRGRVFGLLTTISACLLPIGMGLAGAIAPLVGNNISLIYLFCAACMALITLVASVISEFRRYLTFEPSEQRDAVSSERRSNEIVGAD